MQVTVGMIRACAILAIVAAARVAGAAPDSHTLVLSFETGPESRPNYLCILSETGVPDETGDAKNPRSLALERLRSSPPDADNDVWRIQPASLVSGPLAGDLENRPVLAAALRSMATGGTAAGCGARPELCAPAFRLPAKVAAQRVHVFCGRNAQDGGDVQSPRTAVVFVGKLAAATVAIRDMRLEGTLAALTLTAAVAEDRPPSASVVGGHYVASRNEPMVGRTITLPLTPRCRRRHLDVAAMPEGTPAALTVAWKSAGGRPATLSCDAHVADGKIAIDLPVRGLLDPSVAVTVGDASRFLASLEAFLPEGDPPPILWTRIREVAFEWRRHCLHSDRGECPRAFVGDARLECARRTGTAESCSYVCSRERSSPVLPSRVEFEGRDADRWTGVLTSAGQTLADFVPPHDRTLILDFSRWGSPPVTEGEKELIERVDVLLPGIGEPARVPMRSAAPLGRLRVRVPGLECSDDVEYELVTRRRSFRRVASARTGVVDVARPEDLTSPLLLGVNLWAGYARPIDYPRFYGPSGDELPFPDNATFAAELSVRWLPWNRRWFLDAALGYALGQYEYRTDSASTILDGVYYQRYMASAAGGLQPYRWLAAMAVVRGTYGNPLVSGNGQLAPTDQFAIRAGPRVELWRGTHGAFALEYTVGWNERVHRVSRADPSSPQQLASREGRNHSWLLVGYRFNLR